MRSKLMQFSNFSRAIHSHSQCYRIDKETQISSTFKTMPPNEKGVLVRGNGLSYGDCCLNHEGSIVDIRRLNHLIAFDEKTSLAICQPGVTFADLFLLNKDYIPPVIPGTLYATLGGGIANDVHGKNNTQKGSLAHHIQWLELQNGEESIRCSWQENSELFAATLGGLGLTGLIKRVALKMQKSPRFVTVYKEPPPNRETLIERLYKVAQKYEYQVAWLDILNPSRSILFYANYSSTPPKKTNFSTLKLPQLPVRLLYPLTLKMANYYYYKSASLTADCQSLEQFNNPLDKIRHWNYWYGKKGLLQFQAVFDKEISLSVLEKLQEIIVQHKAQPTMTVLKYFHQASPGLLAFTQPGFTIAIDFFNSKSAKAAILQMNELITKIHGKVYLAKDLFLTANQFKLQYPQSKQFVEVIRQYSPVPMRSNLSRRLEIFE